MKRGIEFSYWFALSAAFAFLVIAGARAYTVYQAYQEATDGYIQREVTIIEEQQ